MGAGYAHMWGAPNAMNRLAQDTGKYIYNIDGLRYGGMSGYMWRTAFDRRPTTSTPRMPSWKR